MLVCSLVIVRLHVNVSLFVYKLESECAFMYFKELFFQKKKRNGRDEKNRVQTKFFYVHVGEFLPFLKNQWYICF